MMMKATPASPFKVTETNLLLEFLIVTLDTPAQLRGVDKVAERNVLRKRGEPIFAGLILAFRPLDQQPFLRRFLEFVVRSLANRLIVNPMGEVLGFIWCAIAGLFRSRVALQAEILVLRHQLNVLRRRSPKRVVLGNIDRLVFCGLYRLSPTVLHALKILEPETVIRWHRAGFRAYWRWRSGRRGGRPKTPADIRDLIREMSVANPLWGAPRI